MAAVSAPESEIDRLMAEKEQIKVMLENSNDVNEQTKLQSKLSIVSSDILCAHLRQNKEMMVTVTANSKKLSELDATVSMNSHDIAVIQDETAGTRHTVQMLNGRIAQLENRLEEAHEAINDLTARSMRMNLVIKSKGELYKEQRGENYQTTVLLFRNFLRDEMGVPDAHKIVITRAHRMGFAPEGFNRPMIANLLMQSDIDRIMNRVAMLKGKSHSINIQVPPEYNERRQHAWGSFKTARGGGREAKLRPNGDLYVDKNLIRTLQPQKIPVNASANLSEIHLNFPYGQSALHGNAIHKFCARSVAVNTTQGIRDAMDIFCAQTDLIACTQSVSYAFRIRAPGGALVENFNSRGDTGVGPQILRILREKNSENIVCFTAHGYKDKTAEPKQKSQLIEQCVGESLATLLDAQNDEMRPDGDDE